jgi:hypothetical protein
MKKPQHHPEYLRRIHLLAPLLRQYQPLSMLQVDDIADWIAWYWNRGTIAYIIDDYDVPQGVCLIKLFKRLNQFMDLVHEPSGKFAFIELAVAEQPLAMGQMLEIFIKRWGPQAVVMWDRSERTESGCPRMYRWSQFQKLARRLSYGATEYVQYQ